MKISHSLRRGWVSFVASTSTVSFWCKIEGWQSSSETKACESNLSSDLKQRCWAPCEVCLVKEQIFTHRITCRHTRRQFRSTIPLNPRAIKGVCNKNLSLPHRTKASPSVDIQSPFLENFRCGIKLRAPVDHQNQSRNGICRTTWGRSKSRHVLQNMHGRKWKPATCTEEDEMGQVNELVCFSI